MNSEIWKEVRIDSYSNAARNQNTDMRITHMPTGIMVKGTGRSKFILENQLMAEIEEKVNNSE